MIKKQQKWIALLVVCTFMWLMQVSTMPVAAAGTTAQVSAAGSEQAPDVYESVSQMAAPAKKKSILPIILIGAGLLTVTAVVLFLFVLKGYDIRGDWNVDRTAMGSTYNFTVKFSGEKASGTFQANQGGTLLNGTYTVDGKNVVWTFESGSKYSGTFSDKDTMSGPYLKYDGTTTGTWTATRIAAAAALPVIQSQKGQLDRE